MHSAGVLLAFIAATLAGIAVLALIARKLIGLRAGLLRTAVAGGLGLAAETIVGRQLNTGDGAGRWTFLTIQLGVALLAGMAFLMLSEWIFPPRSATSTVLGVRRYLSRQQRYWRILRIAGRHRLFTAPVVWRRATPEGRLRIARHLREALEEGGVTFVKLGQFVAACSVPLPEEIKSELCTLHSGVAPMPWRDVEQVLEAALGSSVGSSFASVDHVALASAAVAQVHRAKLRHRQVLQHFVGTDCS